MKRFLWWTLTVLLAVATLATTAFAAWHWIASTPARHDPADSAKDRQVVIDFVNSSVPKLLTYTPDTVDTTLHAAVQLTGGAFHDYYAKFIDSSVIPAAHEKQVSTVATVVGAAVTSLTDHTAELVAFVNQSTTTPPSTDPSTANSSIRIGLERTSGSWLITSFDPV